MQRRYIKRKMLYLSAPQASGNVFYYIATAAVYGCIAVLVVLSLYYGRRARRNVKNERVTRLPDGFSPLDVQRIFIGKTYPRRITRALIAWWAERGYISVTRTGMFTVELKRNKSFPYHDTKTAVFYDRGTYVRERDLFMMLFRRKGAVTVNLLRPMFEKRKKNDKYATREDVGVYSAKHYRLKIIALLLSVAPLVAAVAWLAVARGQMTMFIFLGMAAIGLFVLKFMDDIPIAFRLVWCGMWLGVPVGMVVAASVQASDPAGIGIAASAILLVGTLVLVRFVDYRERINLADYSDIVNYRKFLLRCKADELSEADYRAALPFVYAFRIKPLVGRKLKNFAAPEWYTDRRGEKAERGAML